MSQNLGFLTESEIATEINGLRVAELSGNFKTLLIYLYGVLDNSEVVKCRLVEGYIKPDIEIEYMGIKKYISIKTGNATVIHTEDLKRFCIFLRDEIGISNRTLQTILLHHYGDGTLDGTGTFRYSAQEVKERLKDRIKEANEELNQSKEIGLAILERCLLFGVSENSIEVDGIYFDTKDLGVFANRKQIINYIMHGNWDWTNNLHIGPMHIRPNARYAGKEIVSEERRSKTYIYWPTLYEDIVYIMRKFKP